MSCDLVHFQRVALVGAMALDVRIVIARKNVVGVRVPKTESDTGRVRREKDRRGHRRRKPYKTNSMHIVVSFLGILPRTSIP